MTPAQILTASEAARLIRVKPQTLAVWRTAGTGPRYLRLGRGDRGRVLYRREDVEEWLAERVVSSTAEEHERKRSAARGKR